MNDNLPASYDNWRTATPEWYDDKEILEVEIYPARYTVLCPECGNEIKYQGQRHWSKSGILAVLGKDIECDCCYETVLMPDECNLRYDSPLND